MTGDPTANPARAKVAKWSALVDKNPDHELARYSLGSALMECGEFAAAEPHFARALALRDDWVMAYILRAKCLLQLRRPAEAKELLLRGRHHSIEQKHDAPVEEIDALLGMLP
ncbi:MAG: tetratricopeptide repeat protein [Planctomycetes bacterium]|nr:tetratricopeptide repeat protein [Planctomycetota bacterium]